MAELRPKWKLESTIRAGQHILALLDTHGDRLSEALPPDTKETLRAGVDALRAAESATSVARTNAESATAGQNESLVAGALEVSAWRGAIRRTHPRDRTVQTAFGIGTPFSTKSVRSIVSAMKLLLDAAANYPEAAREAAISPASIERMRASLEAVIRVDEKQERKKMSSKTSRLKRIQTQIQVERTIDRIVAAAIVTFMGQPQAEAFTSVLPRKARGRKNAKAPESEPSPS